MLGAAGQVVKVYAEVFVEVYAHAIWIFVVFWSDLVAQLLSEIPVEERSRCPTGGEIPVVDEGFTTVGFSSGSVTGCGITIGCRCLTSRWRSWR